MCDLISEVLLQVAHDARYERRGLARAAECSESKLSRVLSEQSKFDQDQIRRLSLYLARHGDLRIAGCFITAGYVIVRREEARSNGRIDDEMNDLVIYAGAASEAHARRDVRAMDEQIMRLREVLSRIEAERDRL